MKSGAFIFKPAVAVVPNTSQTVTVDPGSRLPSPASPTSSVTLPGALRQARISGVALTLLRCEAPLAEPFQKEASSRHGGRASLTPRWQQALVIKPGGGAVGRRRHEAGRRRAGPQPAAESCQEAAAGRGAEGRLARPPPLPPPPSPQTPFLRPPRARSPVPASRSSSRGGSSSSRFPGDAPPGLPPTRAAGSQRQPQQRRRQVPCLFKITRPAPFHRCRIP